MAKLVILSEGMTGKSHELKVEKTSIGRVEDNTFQIPEASISSHHCEVLLRGAEVVINDLNSTNGTFINGQQVSGQAVLKPGQILRLGQIELRLEDPDTKQSGLKKLPDQTMIIPQGVKLGQDAPAKTAAFDKSSSGFAKKSNKGKWILIGLMVLVAAVLAIIFIFANSASSVGGN